jgi:two-component SAPR family response regulator
MLGMNGLVLSQRVLELDPNIRMCFISDVEIDIDALREVYPNMNLDCFIQKPVIMEYLVKRLKA